MEFIIHPYEGVEIPGKGMIRFGMTREEVRAFFDEEPKKLFKPKGSKVPVDAFRDYYAHFFYDEGAKFIAVEFGYLSRLLFHSKNLFSFQSIDELKNFLNDLDGSLVAYDSGYDSKTLGISIYSPDPDQNPAEGIMVFRRGYLEELEAAMTGS